jgi:cytochrome c-type biogenesis protein CcmE
LLLVSLLLAGLSVAVALGLSAFRQNLLYFHTPSQVVAGKVPTGVHFRLGGLVEKGSVHYRANTTIAFRVVDCDHGIPVEFSGTLPDLFRPGESVIALGHLNANGVLIADEVLAKHDANYESPAIAEETRQTAKGRCMPANPQASK